MRITELRESYKKFGPLYPVLVDKEGNIIDGFHRKKVDPNWPEMTIDVKDEIEKKKLALICNVIRREISREEIRRRLDDLAEATGWTPKRIAEEIGMSEDWVRKYISQKYKNEVRAKAAFARWCHAKNNPIKKTSFSENKPKSSSLEDPNPLIEDEIIERREVQELGGDGKVTKTIEERSYLLDYIDDERFLENVWYADGRGKGDKIYGDPTFHGNTPPVLFFLCLMKYTSEGDTVLDPMAGSGTSIDICNEFNRKIIAFDIKPMRDDIKFGDAEHIALEDESVDFVFCHFPYWNMVKYSDDERDLSNLNLVAYLDKVHKIFSEFHRVLKPNKFCAVLIGDKRAGKLIDLSAHLSIIGSKFFTLHDKIIWIAKNQRSRGRIQNNLTKYRAKKYRFHIQTFDTLLIFRKI